MKIDIEKIERFKNGQFSMNDYLSVKKYFIDKSYHSDFKKNFVIDEDGLETQQMDYEPILDKIHHQIRLTENKGNRRILRIYHSFSRVAVLLLIPAIITIVILSHLHISDTNENISFVSIYSPASARTHFILPDGSEGWLNSNSSIKYQTNFKNIREVELKGEAWFNVEHDRGKDFIVQTTHLYVNVLGTQFNVAAYEDDESSKVILEEGKVLVSGKNDLFSKSLVTDQELEYNVAEKCMTVKTVDASSYTAWKEGFLISRNQPMSELAERLERRYNADIILHGEKLKELILRATFEDESLEDILKLISITDPIKYKFHKKYKQENDTYSKTKVEIWLKNQN